MFFLGHMTWAYVWGMAFARKRSTKLFVPAVLMFGVLPDIDLFLRRFGVVHHTFTHSFFFWFVVFAPFLMVFRLKAIPYLAAVVQHFAFGDFLVGSVTILAFQHVILRVQHSHALGSRCCTRSSWIAASYSGHMPKWRFEKYAVN